MPARDLATVTSERRPEQGRRPGRRARSFLAAIAFSTAALASTASAQAADLLVLNGDSATLSGGRQYGIVYIDGNVNFTGDTAISASSIYVGPHARLNTCYVSDSDQNGCTAGRSLSLSSSGPLSVAPGFDLTAGSGTARPGGSLTLSGSPVSVGGDVNTQGSGGAASGSVSISSAGSLSVGQIYAPGAAVKLTAQGSIDVAGDIDTDGSGAIASPDPARVASAGPVSVSSSSGDVRIDGTVNSSGLYASQASGLSGGNGASVSISGGNVRTGAIDATGGGSATAQAGSPAPITISARGTLDALGRIDASGQGAPAGSGSPGKTIDLRAAGGLTVASADAAGGQGPAGGSGAGQITLAGASVTAGALSAGGGSGPSGTGAAPGAPGGAITVTAPNGATVGNLRSEGGSSYSNGPAGSGGPISVTSTGGSVATGAVVTRGGYTGGAPGAGGAPVTLSASGDLAVGGTVDTSGSSAGGSSDPATRGGDAGAILLRAATGTLSLGGNVVAEGGRGGSAKTSGQPGGAGGKGAHIDVIAHALGPVVSISSRGGDGGDYGNTQGAGGSGGGITAWTNGPLFDDQKVVSADGGDGSPAGPAGAKRQNSSPTALKLDASGQLSFTSNSPDADTYRVLTSADGAPAQTLLQTSATSGIVAAPPVCKTVTFTVVAVNTPLGWTSDPSGPVTYTRPPSATQRCTDPPRITAAELRRSLKALRAAHWRLSFRVRGNGVGDVQATLFRVSVTVPPPRRHKRGAKPRQRRLSSGPLATATAKLTAPGVVGLDLALPAAARQRGRYHVRLLSTAPDGSTRATTTVGLEIS